MDKRSRNYQLLVQKHDHFRDEIFDGKPIERNISDFIEVKPPFTLQFDVEQKARATTNTSSFRLYNLGNTTRSLLRKDQTDYQINRKVILKAGYGDQIPTIFNGYLMQGWSVREGVDFITTCLCSLGNFASVNGILTGPQATFKKGTPYFDVISSLILLLKPYGIERGVIGNFPGELLKDTSYGSNIIDQLNEITGNAFFIANGRAYALRDEEVINGPLDEISSASGLLGTPIRENRYIYVDILFEPRIQVAQLIRLNTSTGDSGMNQNWKVLAIKHTGMISDAVCGDAKTRITLCSPTTDLKLVSQ